MNYKQLFYFLLLVCLYSCKQETHLAKIEGARLEINDSLTADQAIEAFVKPYREHVNRDLDSVLAYAIDTYSKSDGELNTAIGNLMADIIVDRANPIYKSRTSNSIDMVMVNHGGIRSIISKGNITTRTAYEVMPFENSIVVSEMKGKLIKEELIPYLLRARRAHPISGLQLRVDNDFNLIEAKINGESIQDNKTYHVATNDYLYFGGDRMIFFKKGDSLHILDYKIRNALIDYFKSVDTINPMIDERFIKVNQ